MAEKRIKVAKVRDVVSKRTGAKFKAYQCVDNKGNLMDLKFQQAAHNIPTEPCFIICDEEMVNVNTRTEYPTVWVKDVKRIEPLRASGTNAGAFFDDAAEEEASPF